MKKMVTKSTILAAAGLAVLAMAAPAFAAERLMRVEIPFSFLAGEQRMHSGIYQVRVDGDFHVLDLTSYKDGNTCRVQLLDSMGTRSSSQAQRGVLSFAKYGPALVLKGVSAPGATTRYGLKLSHAEAELAGKMAQDASGVETLDLP